MPEVLTRQVARQVTRQVIEPVVLRLRPFADFLRYLAERDIPVSLEAALKHAADTKFDGPMTIHFRGGRPQKIEAGRPIQVDLLP